VEITRNRLTPVTALALLLQTRSLPRLAPANCAVQPLTFCGVIERLHQN
jgi:hypothetical protein